MIPADIDYCIALDMDEVLVAGWREHFEKTPPGVTRPRYKYVWNWNPDGTEGLVYGADKAHARKGYRWRHPVHEVLSPTDGEVQSWIGMQIHHFADRSKSRGQYLPLLKKAVDELPNDDRNAYYYARELFFHGQNDQALTEFKRHLALPTAQWRPERAASMRYLAKIETSETETWLLRACAEAPDFREPWVELASHYYGKKQWANSLAAAQRALAIKEKPLLYLCDAYSWGLAPHDFAAIASSYLGQKKQAIDYCHDALRIEPNNERMQENMSLMLRDHYYEKITAVIPTKSNVDGALDVIDRLQKDGQAETIVVVADGPDAFATYEKLLADKKNVVLKQVELGAGIHVMWNLGIDVAIEKGTGAVFINDDVILGDHCAGALASLFEYDKSIGIACAGYDYRKFTDIVQDVNTVCNGRYDGTGGLAGFCMALSKDLIKTWRFDESMKWWYGDNDVLNWVLKTQKRRAVITSVARCSGNSSSTIENDPPDNFVQTVQDDKLKFYVKWNIED